MTASSLPPVCPSGEQVALQHGAYRATVVEVGGGLRELSAHGVSLLDTYTADAMADGGRGQPLLPWPNRIRDGAYAFEGRALQLGLSEVKNHNASHGLTRWANWRVARRSATSCTMELRLHPSPGYPFMLDLALRYALDDRGLTVALSMRNVGATAAPVGAGFHPYLTVGTPLVDQALLTLPAHTVLTTDSRGLPTQERKAVVGTPLDFTSGRAIGTAVIDAPYTDLDRGADGRVRTRFTSPTGRVVELWAGRGFDYLMVFTGDTLAPARRRQGLAVEPMTCPPDAFNSGEGLKVLAPDEAFEAEWGISAHVPESERV